MHTSQSSIYENGKVNGILGIVRDVTERKKAEEKLKESEEKYRKLFESAQDGILIINTETGRITDANPFIEKLLGYNKNEFVGKQIFEISPFKDIVPNKNKFKELQRKKYVRYSHLPLETKKGKKISVEFISNVYPIDHSLVIQANIRDITEQKKAEEKLKQYQNTLENTIKKRTQELSNKLIELKVSQKKYQTLFISSQDALMTLAPPTWKFTAGNPATVKMFNCKDEKQFISLGPWQVSPKKQPDGQLSSVKAKKMIDKVSDFNECSNLASIFGDNDYLNNKDIARELFEKCLEFDVDDALDIAGTGSIIANQDLDLLGDVDLAKKFFEKAYKVATEDQDWMNIASSMTDSLNEIFILEAKKIYIKIAENSDDIGFVCDSIETIFDPERFNDSELAHRELKKYLSKAQSLDDLQKLVSTSVFCEDNELALNFFKEAIGKVNNSDDENEILGIVDNVVLRLNTKLFIGVDLSPISCPSENKNFVLDIIKINEYLPIIINYPCSGRSRIYVCFNYFQHENIGKRTSFISPSMENFDRTDGLFLYRIPDLYFYSIQEPQSANGTCHRSNFFWWRCICFSHN